MTTTESSAGHLLGEGEQLAPLARPDHPVHVARGRARAGVAGPVVAAARQVAGHEVDDPDVGRHPHPERGAERARQPGPLLTEHRQRREHHLAVEARILVGHELVVAVADVAEPVARAAPPCARWPPAGRPAPGSPPRRAGGGTARPRPGRSQPSVSAGQLTPCSRFWLTTCTCCWVAGSAPSSSPAQPATRRTTASHAAPRHAPTLSVRGLVAPRRRTGRVEHARLARRGS